MFQIGQRVKRISFIDCFGQPHPAVTNLTVIETRLETPTHAQDLPAYQRLTAVRGFAQYEGGAHFFEKEEEAHAT